MTDFTAADQRYMQLAVSLAEEAGEHGEVPVGAVLVSEDQVVGRGRNSLIGDHDVSAHAEINALRAASASLQNYRLPNTTLYVTLEPCAMCAGAIVHARVARVVCATQEPRAGAGGSVLNVLQHPSLNHFCSVEFGLMQAESAALLTSFFKARR